MAALSAFDPGPEPPAKPLGDWGTLWAEMLGCRIRLVQGRRWEHRFIEAGTPDKAPLLLLHGLGGHSECWGRNIRRLSADFHVVAADMVFHGFSGKNDWDAARWIDVMADGVIDLLDVLEWDSTLVEGESLGAHVAFNVGLRFPERLQKVVLNTGLPLLLDPDAPAPLTRPGAGSGLVELSHRVVLEPTFDTMKQRMQWLVASPERMTDEMVETRLRLYRDPAVNESMRRIYGVGGEPNHLYSYPPDEISSFKPETLVLWTDHNPGRPWEGSRPTVELFDRATYYVMADAGHWPQWERPELHDALVTRFLQDGPDA